MRMPTRSVRQRKGMTLLEVLLALAIFLLSLIAIGSLFNTATDQAVEIQWRSRAASLAQTKLHEFAAGVFSLQAGGSGTFEEDTNWQWNAEITQDTTALNLFKVKVTVSRDLPNKRHVETSLAQYIFDPKMKGVTGAAASSSSSSTTGSGTMTTGGGP